MNKYSTIRSLKFTLIFTIVSGIVNLVSVNTAVGAECLIDEQTANSRGSESDVTSTKTVTEKQLNDLNKCFEQKIDSSTNEIKNDFQVKLNNSLDKQTFFSKNNSLLFIDLPILVTLLSLWLLNYKQQQQQIDKLIKNQKKIIGNFNQFNQVNNKLNDLDRISHQIIERIANLEVRLPELISKQQANYFTSDRNYSDFNSNTNSYSSNSDISSLNSIAIVDKITQLVETYNQDKNSISDKAKFMVAETQASLNQRRSGSSNTVTLENTSQKKYCIIEEDSDNYLVPHAKIKFDDFNKSTLESLFYCTNFTSDYSDFQLVKPAKVSQIDLETWQLEERGRLDFS